MNVKVFDISGPKPVEGTIPADQVTEAVASGQFSLPKNEEVPVFSPDGQRGTLPASEAPEAFKSGFQYASPKIERQMKHSSLKEQALTAIEGLGEGAVGPLMPAAARAIGVPSEDIRAREEINPGIHSAAKTIGLVAGPAGKIGSAIKVGSLPFKLAVEGALYGAQNELSKLVKEDPSQTLGSAAVNVGLSGLVGGALGASGSAANKLWEASKSSKAGEFVDGFKKRVLDHMEGNLSAAPIGVGAKLADRLVKSGTAKLSSGAMGASFGAGLGHITGLPGAEVVGAILGKDMIGSKLEEIMPSLIRPLLQNGTNPLATKQAVEYLSAAAKGIRATTNAAKDLFKSGSFVLAQNEMPTSKQLETLSKALEQQQANPMGLMSQEDQLGHHFPDHSMALSAATVRASQYLNSLRPQKDSSLLLQKEVVPSKVEEAKYNRALSIAEQPLMIMQHLKDGTLKSEDMQTLAAVWPEMGEMLKAKTTEQLMNHLSKGQKVPLKMVPGLSMFLGIPLDSSAKPQNIMTNQLSLQKAKIANQPAPPKQADGNHTKALNNLTDLASTGTQSREKNKGQR